jgi:hypothetical protein
MTQTKPQMTNADKLIVQYDINCTDCLSVWGGLAIILNEIQVDDDRMIVGARHTGYAPNGCPILTVEFGNVDAMRHFTAAYLGCADPDREDVDDYLNL